MYIGSNEWVLIWCSMTNNTSSTDSPSDPSETITSSASFTSFSAPPPGREKTTSTPEMTTDASVVDVVGSKAEVLDVSDVGRDLMVAPPSSMNVSQQVALSYSGDAVMTTSANTMHSKPIISEQPNICKVGNQVTLSLLHTGRYMHQGSVSFILSDTIISRYTCIDIRYVSTIHFNWF